MEGFDEVIVGCVGFELNGVLVVSEQHVVTIAQVGEGTALLNN